LTPGFPAEVRVLGFAGLGVMGEPMCANLARKSGLPVHAYDIAPQPLARLAGAGVRAADSLAALAGAADVVFLCLASPAQTTQVCVSLAQARATGGRTRVVVDTGTTGVRAARDLAARLAEAGVLYVDAPVARMRQAARDGTLSIMVGATPAVFEKLSPYLLCMGSDLTRMGETGAGQAAKVLNNMVLIQTVHALAEALAIGRGLGLDGAVLFEALGQGSADSKALRVQGLKHLVTGDFASGMFSSAYAGKDIGLALDAAEMAGVDAASARATGALLQAACGAGYQDAYYPVFLKLIEAGSR
jgi:3-hydroxyisobutyrate dehydrogenase-like beta-hydroxyacid dehydrogenase